MRLCENVSPGFRCGSGRAWTLTQIFYYLMCKNLAQLIRPRPIGYHSTLPYSFQIFAMRPIIPEGQRMS